jgi:hypothetical protein
MSASGPTARLHAQQNRIGMKLARRTPAGGWAMQQAGVSVAHVIEQRRVEAHLRGAEQLARRRNPRLDSLRARNRALLLDELARYRKAGRFPRNHEFRNALVPHFVDTHGTRCALAHLLEISGQAELVRDIATYRNNARVRELSSSAELIAWLASAGLSLEEAARIQPSYCYPTHAEECFCSPQGPAPIVAIGTILGAEGEGLVRVQLERVEGSPTSVVPGDEVPAWGRGSAGERTLLWGTPDRDGGGTIFQQVGFNWTVTDYTATCNKTPFRAGSPGADRHGDRCPEVLPPGMSGAAHRGGCWVEGENLRGWL